MRLRARVESDSESGVPLRLKLKREQQWDSQWKSESQTKNQHKQSMVRLDKPESKRVRVKFESDSGAESKCGENDSNECKGSMRARRTT